MPVPVPVPVTMPVIEYYCSSESTCRGGCGAFGEERRGNGRGNKIHERSSGVRAGICKRSGVDTTERMQMQTYAVF